VLAQFIDETKIMLQKYDIIIIGGGNAGFGVSTVAHDAGKKIAFIEERDFGGTCPNRGCTPKKVLVAAANAMHEINRAYVHCIDVNKPKLNWSQLIKREKDMISFIPDAMAEVAGKRGDVYYGTAKFKGPNTVSVGDTLLEANNIVIATGSKTRPLPIPGANLMITSDEVLSEESQPEDVVFIGGGVIAMEFSHVYARAGTKVHILEAMPRLLPRIEEDAVAAIREESERIGIEIETDVQVYEIVNVGPKLQVSYKVDGENKTLIADRIVNGAGRIANVDKLDLDAGNVQYDGIAVKVDAHMRSISNPSVWVCGDSLATTPQLSPVATYEGQMVGENIVHGANLKANYDVLPSSVYTIPALSTVGLSEKEASDKGLNVRVGNFDMRDWFSGKSYAETVAWAKILINKDDDQIVGAHIVGHRSEELIHLFAMAMRHKIAASDLKTGMFAYPTFSSDVKNLL
jgi:glutathione reductase (NADPH)